MLVVLVLVYWEVLALLLVRLLLLLLRDREVRLSMFRMPPLLETGLDRRERSGMVGDCNVSHGWVFGFVCVLWFC